MENILPQEETLKNAKQVVLATLIDIDSPSNILLELEEVRAELVDDNINFMGLATPKHLYYLNFAETMRDLP